MMIFQDNKVKIKLQTIEGNKIIAEFDGWEIEQGMGNEKDPYYIRGFNMVMLSEMGYPKSWDWLMPAWRKLYLKISERPSDLCYDDRLKEHVNALRYWYDEMGQPLTKVLIELAWKTLVEAIQWYNTTKPCVLRP